MSKDKNQQPPKEIKINEEKGLKPVKNPPSMPEVKPPKSEKSS